MVPKLIIKLQIKFLVSFLKKKKLIKMQLYFSYLTKKFQPYFLLPRTHFTFHDALNSVTQEAVLFIL